MKKARQPPFDWKAGMPTTVTWSRNSGLELTWMAPDNSPAKYSTYLCQEGMASLFIMESHLRKNGSGIAHKSSTKKKERTVPLVGRGTQSADALVQEALHGEAIQRLLILLIRRAESRVLAVGRYDNAHSLQAAPVINQAKSKR